MTPTATITDDRALALAERANRKTRRELAVRETERLAVVDRLLEDFDRKASGETLEALLRLGVAVSEDRVEHVYGRMTARERRALLDRELVLERGRLVPRVRGGVIGMQYAAFRNAPPGAQGSKDRAGGDWVIDPDTFYSLTVRNEQLVAAPSSATGWLVASPLDFPLAKRGILHELCFIFTGTMTVTPGTGSFTQGWKWPWGNFGRIALQSSGEAGVQYGSGVDFRTRIERLYRCPVTGSTAGAGAGVSGGTGIAGSGGQSGSGAAGVLQSGANTIKIIMKVPVAHDLRTGMGSIFRASDDLNLVAHVDPPAAAELVALTGNATAVWSNVNVQLVETYMRVVRDGAGRIVLPDISRIFMTTVEEVFFSNNGTVSTPIPRLPGVLLSISHVLDQGATVIAPSALSQMRFVYGENQRPITLLPDRALEINRRNYDGPLNGGNYWAIDGEVDNPKRDVWIPRNFTEGALEVDIPSNITPLANSRSHVFFESLVQAQLQ
jgi:hypothetical protein